MRRTRRRRKNKKTRRDGPAKGTDKECGTGGHLACAQEGRAAQRRGVQEH